MEQAVRTYKCKDVVRKIKDQKLLDRVKKEMEEITCLQN